MATTAKKMCYPSALERRWLCPGSAAMEAMHPYEQISSEAALEGIMLHGRTVDVLKNTNTDLSGLTEEQVNAIRWVESMVRPLMNRPGVTVVYEEALNMRHVGIENNYKLDILILDQDFERIIVELKYGMSYITAPQWNKQIRAYAYGTMEHFGGEVFRAILLQPRLFIEDKRYREAEWTAAQVATFGDEIRGIVKGCEDPEAPLVPGKKQCMFCRAKETCDARVGNLSTIPTHLKWEAFMDALEPEDRFDMVQRLEAAAAYISTLQASTERYVMEGNIIPGYTIGVSEKRKVWGDKLKTEMALRTLAVELGKNPEDLFTAPALKGTTDIYRILGRAKRVVERVEALRIQPEGEPCMVKDPTTEPKLESKARAFFAKFIKAPARVPQLEQKAAAR